MNPSAVTIQRHLLGESNGATVDTVGPITGVLVLLDIPVDHPFLDAAKSLRCGCVHAALYDPHDLSAGECAGRAQLCRDLLGRTKRQGEKTP